MSGEKWLRTMTTVVAICKATSMINNIHVTVSFRCTQSDGKEELPYVILAYDSKKDKFSKVKNLFQYLEPAGCTPEGLAFEAIMKLFNNITPDEEDRFFLNLSDGEPYYHISTSMGQIYYMNDTGVTHTKSQVDKIKRKGVRVLSYFIKDESPELVILNKDANKVKQNFTTMYGKSAQFIDIENVVELARTMNKYFLKSSQGNSP